MCDENAIHLQQREDGGLKRAPGKRSLVRREHAAVRTVFQGQRTDHIPGNPSTFERRIPLSNIHVEQKINSTVLHIDPSHFRPRWTFAFASGEEPDQALVVRLEKVCARG